MLNIMRKHARGWLIKIILVVIAVVFIIGFGIGGYGPGQDDRLVEVNGVPITSYQLNDELGKLQEEAKRQFGEQFAAISKFLDLKRRALSNLVDQVLMRQAANSFGVMVTDQELQASIAAIPAFQSNGAFNQRLYARLLNMNHLTPAGFEESQRMNLLAQKLSALVVGSVEVTPLEVDQALVQAFTKVKGSYLVFKPADFAKGLTASDQDLKSYYDQHKQQYQVPAQVKLVYLTFPAADFADKVNVTDEDIADVYQIQRRRYIKPEQVKASHILIKAAPDALPEVAEAAKKTAEKILALAKEGKTPFAELAKKHSEGPTGPNGGDLGTFGKGQMDPAFEALAFSLKAGEMGVTRSRFGYHVVLVTEHLPARTIPLAEVAGEIRKVLEEERANRMALAAAEKAFELIAGGASLQQAAEKLKLSPETSDWVVLGDSIPALPGAKDLKQALAGMEMNQVARPLLYKLGAALVAIGERKDAHYQPLKEVEEDVRQKVLVMKAEGKAMAAAAELIKKTAAEAKPAEAMAKAEGVTTTDWLSRGGKIEGLAGSEAMVRALFLRPDDKPVAPKPLKVGDGFAVVVLAGRQAPDAAVMQDKREEVQAQLLTQQRKMFFEAFRTDLSGSADIKILGKI